jgi:peptidoglycan hydrolase CwlO-like protein
MRRNRPQTNTDDTPLASNAFFRRVEEAEETDTAPEPLAADDEFDAALEPAWEDDDGGEVDPATGAEDPAWEAGDEGRDGPAAPRRRARPAGAGTPPMVAAGWVLGLAGAGLGLATQFAATALGPVPELLAALGLSPFGLVLAGLFLGVTGALRGQAARQEAAAAEHLAALERSVRGLGERSPRPEVEGAAVGDEVDRMLVALQRQDEKINNLTRATKLYGKPLIEISNQVSELANQLQDSGAPTTELEQVVTSAVKDLEKRLAERLEVLSRAVRETQGAVEELNLEVGEAHRLGREEQRRELGEAVEQLRSALETGTTAAAGPNGLDELEQGIATIQREVQGLATTIARLEARPLATAAAAAPAPAARPSAAAKPPAPAAAPAAPSGAEEGLASSIAGARKASGKNVLGAIAKLKSMRS